MSNQHTDGYKDLLKFKAEKGLKAYGLDGEQEYIDRLEYELGIVEDMGFSAYFLICADLCNFMKEEGILFNVRGSGCGSLIVWLIGITHPWLDPIKLGLPFERFLNPDRVSNPDLDMDIDDSRRSEVFDYTVKKYGSDKVARMVTFGTIGAKTAIRDLCRVLKDEFSERYTDVADEVSPLVPGSMSLEDALNQDEFLREKKAKYPKLFDLVAQLEGRPRHVGVHAAGVIICPSPLTDYMPAYFKGNSEKRSEGDSDPATQWDMYDSESRGLLKMDYLGLSTLRVIKGTVSMINIIAKKSNRPDLCLPYTLETIDKKCPKTWDLLSSGQLSGVFQIERHMTRGVAKRMNLSKERDLLDIAALISVIRPGMMDAKIGDDGESATEIFLRRAEGVLPVEPIVPQLASSEYLNKTYGLICYQEQIGEIVKSIAGFTPGFSDTVRSYISKKKMDMLESVKPKFVSGCKEISGLTEEEADHLWSSIVASGRYSFNKAHAAAYGCVTTYQTAWLKANWPLVYMLNLINSEAGKSHIDFGYGYKASEYIEEAKRLGIKVHAPCVARSGNMCRMNLSDNSIRFGLSMIKGTSSSGVANIVNCEKIKKSSTFNEFVLNSFELKEKDYIKVRTKNKVKYKEPAKKWEPISKINTGETIALIRAGALDRFHSDRCRMESSVKVLSKLAKSYWTKLGKTKIKSSKAPSEEELEELKNEVLDFYIDDDAYYKRTLEETIREERSHTGCFLTHSPFEPFIDCLKDLDLAPTSDIASLAYNRQATTLGVITGFRETIVKNGKNAGNPMGILRFSGAGVDMEMPMFSDAWTNYIAEEQNESPNPGDVYLITVYKDFKGTNSFCKDLFKVSGKEKLDILENAPKFLEK